MSHYQLRCSARCTTVTWVLHNRAVSAPIVGATKPHHLPEAIAALELKLTGEEVAMLEKALQQPRAVLVLKHHRSRDSPLARRRGAQPSSAGCSL
jgi:diketogulonate reductase-like aldo/keto reductase